MALNLDPEFVRHIQGIYGDANLDGRTIKQLYQTWQTNPQFIKNAYNQKNQPKTVSQSKSQLAPKAQLNPGQINRPEVANDDLSSITNFSDAFRIANQKGLKQFKWKGTKANPSGMFGTQMAKPTNQKPTEKKKLTPSIEIGSPKIVGIEQVEKSQSPKLVQSTSQLSKQMPKQNVQINRRYDYFRIPDETYEGVKAPNSWVKFPSTAGLDYDLPVKEITSNDRWQYWFDRGNFAKFQQGGTMQQQSQDEEMKKAFIQFLVQDAAAQGVQIQSEQDLQNYAQQLGEEGIQAKYQEFMQRMQGGVKAKLGSKLTYLKKLRKQ